MPRVRRRQRFRAIGKKEYNEHFEFLIRIEISHNGQTIGTEYQHWSNTSQSLDAKSVLRFYEKVFFDVRLKTVRPYVRVV